MIDVLIKIEKEIERMKEETQIELSGTTEDVYTLGINSGLCKALSIIYKCHLEYLDNKSNSNR